MKFVKIKNCLHSMVFVMFVFFCISYTGLSVSFADSLLSEESSNIINKELIIQADDWIYFPCTSDNNRLYKMKTNGSNSIKLSNDKVDSMTIFNDWIYYTSDGNIYRIKKDGKIRTVIYNERNVIPRNVIIKYDKIFFQDDEYGLFQMNLEGKELKNIISIDTICSWTVINYSVAEDYDYDGNVIKAAIYKIKLEGYGDTLKIGKKSRITDDGGNYINIVTFNDGQDRLYYRNASDKGRLYMIKADGSGKIKLTNHAVSNVTVGGFWVYYSNKSDNSKLYRISIVGTVNTKLINAYMKYIYVFSNNIYYISDSNSKKAEKLYRIKTDLSERKEII